MASLTAYLTGFGLATGAGAKAAIPVFLLGAFHYTPYFELSQSFSWIAEPPVMVVLAVLILVELYADAHPELGVVSDAAAYLPKFVAGFIAFAAVTGTVDENLFQLGASGLLGGATAGAVHWLRNRARTPIRDHAEDVHEGVGKAATVGEAGAAALVSGVAVFSPYLLAVAITLVGGGMLVVATAVDRHARQGKKCWKCGAHVPVDAAVCSGCGADLMHDAREGNSWCRAGSLDRR